MQLGFIGLGKMGSRMVSKLLQEGHDVLVWNRTKEKITELQEKFPQIKAVETIQELVDRLENPKIVWLMLPAGAATQGVFDEVFSLLGKDAVLIDGGNAFHKDTQIRFEKCREKGIRFLGIGVSGGLVAGEEGYPLMVGGDKVAYESVKPILDSLAKPSGGHAYFGEGGAGHFVKMVHNGIEYGYMQAIGEGFGVMEKSSYGLNLLEIAKLYQKGTLVAGFMMDRTVDALKNNSQLEGIEGIIAESGEAGWTIETAKEENVPVPVIEESLAFRKKSQTDETIQKSFAARMVSALRNVFGGHEVKRNSLDSK